MKCRSHGQQQNAAAAVSHEMARRGIIANMCRCAVAAALALPPAPPATALALLLDVRAILHGNACLLLSICLYNTTMQPQQRDWGGWVVIVRRKVCTYTLLTRNQHGQRKVSHVYLGTRTRQMEAKKSSMMAQLIRSSTHGCSSTIAVLHPYMQ